MSQLSPSTHIHNKADIEHRLDSLRNEHRDLEIDLDKLSHDTLADDLHVKRLKRRKLQVKDSITKLEDNMIAAGGT